MTREEEIREEEILEAAKEFTFGDRTETSDFFDKVKIDCFYHGAKWSYEHPNLYNDEKYHTVKVSCLDELYRKAALYDTFIEKSCKYLESLVYQEFAGGPLERTFSDEDIEEFRKVMEK